MNPAFENLGPLLGETARLWRANLDKRLQPLGVSEARWQVLLHLHWRGDGVVQKTLAEWLAIEGPSLVRLLDRMATDSLIQRRTEHPDRRAKTVHLTPKAHLLIPEIKQIATQLRAELLVHITHDEIETCMHVLQQIRQRAQDLNTFMSEKSQ